VIESAVAIAERRHIFRATGEIMRPLLALVLTAFLPAALMAEEPVSETATLIVRPAVDSDLSEFLWINRPVVIFADNAADPRFQEQMARLSEDQDMLAERDVIVLTDTDPKARSALRKKLRPRGFMLVIIGKDGGVKLRKPHPWSVREITRSIDKFPSRLREVEERRGS
jgi:hypothetical protein